MTNIINFDNGLICEINETGVKCWYQNGKRHRDDGPAVEHPTGIKVWWVNGKLHREDGPAYEGMNGYQEWWINGRLHRLDGPAYEGIDNIKYWYYEGKRINCKSQEEFEKLIKLKLFW